MIVNQIEFRRNLKTKRYLNGQLAVYIYDSRKEPLAELSIMHNSVELAPNEFILKDYSENEDIVKEIVNSQLITPTDRFVLIGSHFCPIYEIKS